QKEGIEYVAEGSNMDDLGDYRPGLDAVRELGVLSPLRKVELTKAEIREYSKELGLPTADKPSFACLASRIPYGERITPEKLAQVEAAEDLLASYGIPQYRVRVHGNLARIEVPEEYFDQVMEVTRRHEIVTKFREIGFFYVTVDLKGFRSGSMNEVLK
ncbi:MAG: TIGR00268 family protein, partial [Lachnospiraceae bacterium]|nr:TIGR00268 family protein [Lachnospiraceae bacterium]